MLLRLIVAIFCLVLALGALLAFRAGPIVQFALKQAGCEFAAEASAISYFPTRFEARGVEFRQGEEALTAIHAKVEKMEFPLALWPLLFGKIRLGQVILHKPRVEVIEGDKLGEDEPGSSPPDLRVAGVDIREGFFRYRRVYSGKEATISVHEINGRVEKLDARSAEPSAGRVTARLEHSGRVDLAVNAAYFAPTPNVKVALELREQKLSDLNAYFVPADGIELFGTLKRGRGDVSLEGEWVSASAEVKYSEFDILLRSTRERSKGEAFLGNLFRSLLIDDENAGEPRRDQRHGVKLKRKKKESVITTLLRGLRESVLHIATT